MKRILSTLLILAFSTIAFAQQADVDLVAKFKTETIDMGNIPQGTPATVTFEVTNTGKTPLIIEQASPTCGCTIGDYTKEPILPGKAGKITATYNAAGLSAFNKHMNVKFAGYDKIKSITIKGVVLTKEEFAKLPAAATKSAVEATTNTATKAQAQGKKILKSGKKTAVKKTEVSAKVGATASVNK